MNLYKIGVSGIAAAEARINTTAHNIANMGTAGYTRQSVMTSSAGAQAAVNGYIGRGVQVDTVMRQYDAFLYQQLSVAQGKGAQVSAQAGMLEQVSALVADRTTGISPALNTFFKSVNALASSPADAAVRQDLIGQANTLVTQINDAHAQLDGMRDGINAAFGTSVAQANAHLERIHALNGEIVAARATGHAPNDLLDQRDHALTQLNQIIGIESVEKNDVVSVTLASGHALLAGGQVYALHAVPADQDASRTVLAVTLPGDLGRQSFSDAQLTGGSLSGLAQVRRDTLDSLQSQLGQLSVGLAQAFNAVHAQGVAPSGNVVDVFTLGAPETLANRSNGGNATWNAQYAPVQTQVDANGAVTVSPLALEASDYEVRLDGDRYAITRLSDGAVSYSPTDEPLAIPGLTITLSGTPAQGDSWTIKATSVAARDLAVNIKQADDIAAANAVGGAANGQNALALARLQTQRLFNSSSASVADVYASAVNRVGVQTKTAIDAREAQSSLITQKQAAHQSVSGVNANEEYTNLMLYQTQYQANAKVIDTATRMFDALLNLQR